ncbi:MAG TPA: type I methionyl aminopeptidase [Syntrophomonadaceae bacterium]|nr:type I methionyl aminopeptidase [Syntrophomonadaceae bacterium]
MIILKKRDEIEKMRKAGQLVAQVLSLLEKEAKPGVTTAALNALAESQCKKHKAIPVFKNYPHARGGVAFPGVICASINEEVVHGIPGSRTLQEGDIISIDFGVLLNGYAGDSAITVAVGSIAPEILQLIKVTEESLMLGIKEAIPGNRLGQVSNAIQNYAESHGFSVVRDFVGHGIGRQMHEEPPVPNFGKADRGPTLKEGMTLAIEPMINMGTYRVYTKPDGWTVITADKGCSAHFEHTVAITEQGPEILTLR